MGGVSWRDLLFGAPRGGAALAGFRLYGIFGWLEALCWAGLIAVGLLLLVRLRPSRIRMRGRAWILLATAVATRLSVPRAPYNWYFGMFNLGMDDVFTKATTYLPLPNRLAGFESGLGFQGIVALNLTLGVASVFLLWHLARKSGVGELASLLLALLLATTPMYVRLSASDTSQVVILFSWLLSGVAFTSVRDGRGGSAAHVALFCATLVACPVRLESAFMMPAVPLFTGGGPAGWRDVAIRWRRYLAFWLALGIGIPTAFCYHANSFGAKLLDPVHSFLVSGAFLLASLLLIPLRVTGLMNVAIISYLPAVISVPILHHLVRSWRAGDWNELVTTFGPLFVLSVPYAVGFNSLVTDLSSSSYNVIFVVFLLAACSKGLAAMYAEFRRGALLHERWKRLAAAGLLAPAAWFFVVVPYRWTYVFQEEFAFLDRHLPKGRATVATIWDAHSVAGDWDCSLALPYPPFLANRPELKWIVLSETDLGTGRLEDVDFDYYYPGTLVSLDAEKLPPWSLAEFAPASELRRIEPDRERLRRLHQVDRTIRERHRLIGVATQAVPARWEPPHGTGCTGVNFGYPSSNVELTLYRAVK